MDVKAATDPVSKALWYIETRFDRELALDDIAAHAGLSRFALMRAFAATTGRPIKQYVRGRRLTEAARALAAGAPDILAVALDHGYGSHEAFTRAFREQFATTPEAVRDAGSVATLPLVEAVRSSEFARTPLEPPRSEHAERLLIAGLAERDYRRIPLLWQRFGPSIGTLPAQTGHDTYGVCANADDGGSFTYFAGVEVARFDGLPAEFTTIRIPEARYAVFEHRGHVSTIRSTFEAIWRSWQPYNDALDAPFFERYGDAFDPHSGNGTVEIWVPIP
jgi:AraC family transcriptional regulator